MLRRHIKRKERNRKTPLQWPIHSGYRGIICFEVPAYRPMIKPGLLRQVVVFRDEDVLPGDLLHATHWWKYLRGGGGVSKLPPRLQMTSAMHYSSQGDILREVTSTKRSLPAHDSLVDAKFHANIAHGYVVHCILVKAKQ